MKTLSACAILLVTISIGLSLGLGACGNPCAGAEGCALPEKCGEPPQACSCGCFDGMTFHLADGPYVCKNDCLVPLSGDGGTGDGGACASTAVGKLCVRGQFDAASNQEVLTAGGPVRFEVMPKGCFSSSCTVVHEASCKVAVGAGKDYQVTGTFCLEDTSGQQPGCTADCNGGGFANCQENTVAAGSYTATAGGLQVSFTVPSMLPLGGTCVGMQF